jgi:hypothetical protein
MGSVSSLSAGEYSATVYVMVDIVKGCECAPPYCPDWTDFAFMMEYAPESCHCHSVYPVGISMQCCC